MKLYREGNNEIRIRLTKEDLASYSITAEDLDYDSAKGKRVIWELFDKAREETGFEAVGEKLYIQLYPTERGGCELFVTKLEKEKNRICFCFSDFDMLYAALSRATPPPDFELWKAHKNERFYLLTPEKETPALFFEYGEKIKMPSHLFFTSRCRRVAWEERH